MLFNQKVLVWDLIMIENEYDYHWITECEFLFGHKRLLYKKRGKKMNRRSHSLTETAWALDDNRYYLQPDLPLVKREFLDD
jgi:hypothetical protein